MENKYKTGIVLGVMCAALTAGMFLQMRTVENLDTTVSQNYEENNLRAEVLRYKERYDNAYANLESAEAELEKIREESISDDDQLSQMETEIKNGNKLAGFTDVSGPGVIVTLSDSKMTTSLTGDLSDFVVHDMDVLSVINELKNAGAEAISINDQRLVATSSISCGGNIITINGQKVGAPFEIKAIGLPEQLAALSRPGGYLSILKSYGIGAELVKKDNITIDKFPGVMNFKYVRTIE